MTTTTSTTPIQARRPGVVAWLRMFQAEAKTISRDMTNLLLPVGLPLLLLVMFGMSIDDLSQEVSPGVTVMDVYVLPVTITMVIAMVAVMTFSSYIATYRKSKILRRLAVTPASPAMVLVSQLLVSFVLVLVGIAIAYGAAAVFFEANPPQDPLTAVFVLLATSAALYAVGMIVAAVSPTASAAGAIGIVVFFALGALGGMFAPVEVLPQALQDISQWLPFTAAVEAFESAWLGQTVDVQNWVVLGGTTALGAVVSIALFRWE